MPHSHGHEPHAKGGSFLRDIVFGVEDGLISTLGIVAGVSGAAVGNAIVVLAGLAGMLAGAVSMAAGTYLSTKSQQRLYEKELAREEWEIDHLRHAEVQEIRGIYAKKGFRGKALENVVKVITSDRETWLKVMMEEELGLADTRGEKPAKAAAAIALSFVPGGFVPIVPYLFLSGAAALAASVLLTAAGLFAFGAVKGRFTMEHPLVSGLEMVCVGMLAAAVGYAIGLAFNVGALIA